MKEMLRRTSGAQLLVREADLGATHSNEFSWLRPMKEGCDCEGQRENCAPDSRPPNTGVVCQPRTPTRNHECGVRALGAAGAAVLARILAAHIPKQQLSRTPLLPGLSARISLQLQATLAPNHSGIGD